MTRSRMAACIYTVGPGLIALGVWEWAASRNPATAFLFGQPSVVIRVLSSRVVSGVLVSDLLATLTPVLLGFLAGNIVGIAAGLLLWRLPQLGNALRPYLIAFGAVPAFVFAPVLIVWFGTGLLTKVVLVFLSTVLISTFQAHSGALEVEAGYFSLFRSFGASASGVFRHLILPSAAAWVLAGVRLNIGFALLGAFIGEFVSSERGLAHRALLDAGLYNLSAVWASAVVISMIAVILYALSARLERLALPWKQREPGRSNGYI